jgi:hypothetical protein
MAILKSKKFIAALIAGAVAFASEMFGMDSREILLMVSPFLAYIGAQGISDIGKEKAKIENA